MMKHAAINLLEASTVTLDAGVEDAAYPLYRLYDRDIGLIFKPAAAVTIEVLVDQGAGGSQAVDRLLIPSGHNLDGMTLDIMWSEDDVTYTPAVAQWTGAVGLINKTWAPLTKRYWKFFITAPGIIPQFAELFLTSTYTWPRNPSRPAGQLDPTRNVQNVMTASGADRFIVMGGPKRRRVYSLPNISEAHKDALLGLDAAWAGAFPFWVEDHTGAWIFVKLDGPMNISEVAPSQYSAQFSITEVLA